MVVCFSFNLSIYPSVYSLLLRNMWRNTSFRDTCNPFFCITGILSKPKPCTCLDPKVPRNPPLTPAILSWSIWNEVFRPLCWALCPFWPPALSSCSTGHSPCLFTCPQWHGYCKVFVLFWFLLQGLLCNNLLARLFPSLLFSLYIFSVHKQCTDWEYGHKLLETRLWI